jgi:hypothetical protein
MKLSFVCTDLDSVQSQIRCDDYRRLQAVKIEFRTPETVHPELP